MAQLRYLENVVTLQLDQKKCNGCGMCTIVCPHQVFELRDHKAAFRDRDLCMECGGCQRNCESGAISVAAGVGCAEAIIYASLTGREVGCG